MWVLGWHCVGCGSRFWVGWVGVLGRSLVEFGWLVEFWVGVFSSLVCWLVEFFFFPLLLRFLDLEFVDVVAIAVIDENGEEIIY